MALAPYLRCGLILASQKLVGGYGG